MRILHDETIMSVHLIYINNKKFTHLFDTVIY